MKDYCQQHCLELDITASKNAMGSKCDTIDTVALAKLMVKNMDQNGDGQIDRFEFKAHASKFLQQLAQPECAGGNVVLDLILGSADGRVSFPIVNKGQVSEAGGRKKSSVDKESEKLLAHMITLRTEYQARGIAKMQPDSEFYQRHAASASALQDRLFDTYDTNHVGFLSMEECRALMTGHVEVMKEAHMQGIKEQLQAKGISPESPDGQQTVKVFSLSSFFSCL
jgi:hypothetical protein